jgi:hypothetical protein
MAISGAMAGDELVLVDIDLDEKHTLVGIVRRDLFDHGRQLLAGAAPLRPEVDDHYCILRGFDDVAAKCLYRLLLLLAQAQGRHVSVSHSMAASAHEGRIWG